MTQTVQEAIDLLHHMQKEAIKTDSTPAEKVAAITSYETLKQELQQAEDKVKQALIDVHERIDDIRCNILGML